MKENLLRFNFDKYDDDDLITCLKLSLIKNNETDQIKTSR